MRLDNILWKIHDKNVFPTFVLVSASDEQELNILRMIWTPNKTVFEFGVVSFQSKHKPYVTLRVQAGWSTHTMHLDRPLIGAGHTYTIKTFGTIFGRDIRGILIDANAPKE